MPKIRPLGDSLLDMLKHGRVFSARLENMGNTKQRQEYSREITEIVANIQSLLKKLPTDDNDLESNLNEAVSSAINLINKEAKKNAPKKDYTPAFRAMSNCTSLKEVYTIGREYNVSDEIIDKFIKGASTDTKLGKAYATLKAKQKPKPIIVEPPAEQEQDIQQEEEDTIDSELGNDDDLMKLLGADQ